jgi:hypothetical protein
MAVRSFRAAILSGVGVAALATVLSLPLAATAQPQPASPAPAAGAPAQTLERNMSAMNRAFRTINTNVKDKTKNDATLAAVVQLQTATLAAKAQLPDAVEKLTGEEKTKKVSEFRGMMAKLLQAECELEANLIAGDNEKAAATFATIKDMQTAGHKEFRPAP